MRPPTLIVIVYTDSCLNAMHYFLNESVFIALLLYILQVTEQNTWSFNNKTWLIYKQEKKPTGGHMVYTDAYNDGGSAGGVVDDRSLLFGRLSYT